jgi:biotin synthase
MNWLARSEEVLAGVPLTTDEALALLRTTDDELLTVLQAAFQIRSQHFGRGVRLHVIRNARGGDCSEDCGYCSQSATANATASYPWQSREEIVAGARDAAQKKAVRYCVVASGRSPSAVDLDAVYDVVRAVKAAVNIQLCLSLGLLSLEQARQLKAAGLDRYNHNLETSARYFPNTCTTHTYADRLATARAVKAAGLELCCGGLLGMGETIEDRVALAFALREVDADSIPVNLHDPRPGTRFERLPRLRPADALRALAMFRFINPTKELRIAGGREACLGPLQALALYPANSIFTTGYLTTPGQGYTADMALLHGAGFHVEDWTLA